MHAVHAAEGPEVEQHDFAAQLPQPQVLAAGVDPIEVSGKIRRRARRPRRSGCCSPRRARRRRGEHGRDRAQHCDITADRRLGAPGAVGHSSPQRSALHEQRHQRIDGRGFQLLAVGEGGDQRAALGLRQLFGDAVLELCRAAPGCPLRDACDGRWGNSPRDARWRCRHGRTPARRCRCSACRDRSSPRVLRFSLTCILSRSASMRGSCGDLVLVVGGGQAAEARAARPPCTGCSGRDRPDWPAGRSCR